MEQFLLDEVHYVLQHLESMGYICYEIVRKYVDLVFSHQWQKSLGFLCHAVTGGRLVREAKQIVYEFYKGILGINTQRNLIKELRVYDNKSDIPIVKFY